MQDVFSQLNYKLTSDINAFIVDLRKSVDELWKSISHNFRRKVKQAMKEQVELVEAESYEDLLTFYKMVKASGERKHFGPPPQAEYEAVWDIYRPKNMAKIFLAKWKGKYVAGTQIIANRKTLQATSAGSLKEGWTARPSDFLHWKIMEWAIQKGFWYYHLGGAFSPSLIQWKNEFRANTAKICKYDKVFFPKTKSTIGRAYSSAMLLKRLFR
jgi:lipid II:glycine glycyltransferase (peptidoglycan interpeptide bridge formation enzyme)